MLERSQPETQEVNPQTSSSANIFSRLYRLAKLASDIASDYMHNTENALGRRWQHVAFYRDESYLASATIGIARKYLQPGAIEKNILFGGAGALAMEDPRHICHYFIGPQLFYVVFGGPDLEQIFGKNGYKISRHEAVKRNFSLGFGDHNIFTAENGPDQRKQRTDAKNRVFNKESLEKAVPTMQEIIKNHVTKAAEDNSVDLETLCTSITLDMIAILHLGATKSIAHLNKELTELYEKLLVQLFDSNNLARRLLSGLKHKVSFGYIPDNSGNDLLRAKAEVEKFIKEEFMDVHKKNILAKNTLLKDWADISPKTEETIEEERKAEFEEKLNSKELLEKLSMILLAGHDSTGRLLQAALMLLATHPDVFEKLRKDIDDFFAKGLPVNRENITKLIPYLNWVILESLRLFPSAPVIGYAVTEEFTIGHLPDDYKDFKEVWDGRDVTKDVTFKPGDVIIASPYKTHRIYFENPDEFIPERWKGKEELDDLIYPKGPVKFMPFGDGPRACVGFRFGLLEAALTLMEIVRNYNIKMIPTNDQDPFEITAIGTLRFKNRVNMTFAPRPKPENVMQNDVKDQKQEEAEEPLTRRVFR